MREARPTRRLQTATSDKNEAVSTIRLVLASSSPRRRELIAALDLPIEVRSSNLREGPPRNGERPDEHVVRLSLEKAREVARSTGDAAVLGADTSVVVDGAVLGKPADEDEAVRMLRLLRGRDHEVITGVTVLQGASGRAVSSSRSTHVALRKYSDREIEEYVLSGEPMDKAGAYAVQDPDFRPASHLEGCYLNAMGLPLCDVLTILHTLGMPARVREGWQLPDQCVDCPIAVQAGRGPNA